MDLQDQHPSACRVRIAPALIRFHFIIVDRRFVIIPIISHDRETQKQTRYGALFFEDTAGTLCSSLLQMYQAIDSRSRSLELKDFDD